MFSLFSKTNTASDKPSEVHEPEKEVKDTQPTTTLPYDHFYKQFHSHSLEKRIEDANKFFKNYPNKIPTIIYPGNAQTPDVSKHKFILPPEMTIGEFMVVLRRFLTILPDQALFLFVYNDTTDNTVIPTASSTINDVYAQHKNKDMFLKISYTLESTFG